LKKVFITGASGLLGSKLVKEFLEEYGVIPTHCKHSVYPNSVRMDLVDGNEVTRVVSEAKPDFVVHAAAETNVDRCETDKELAWSVNADGTKNIAKACAEIGSKLVYVSTDYVFDGEKGLYTEEDEANPVNYYGVTKLEGERFVRELCEDFVIVRTSVLYGWHPSKTNFATWVIDSLRNGKRISVADDHYNSPTLADNLAEMILRIVEMNVSGVYHTAGSERISRYGFAVETAEVFGLDRSLVTPLKMEDLNVWVAKRPRDSSLSVDKVRRELVSPLGLNEALKRMKREEEAFRSREFK
jgi:dTDP-4-dehydrorhamnose reductase